MPNDNTKADVDISVTDELDAAGAAVISAPTMSARPDTTTFARSLYSSAIRRPGGSSAGSMDDPKFGLVYVAWFFLPEDRRRARIGSWVLAMAEDEGRRRGCTRIALTTLSIEAPGFYLKQGYDVAATIDCEPPGLTRYYMLKKL